MAEQKKAEKTLAEVEAEAAAWQDRARLALEKDREDLARAALAEKQQLVRRAEALRQQVEEYRTLVANTQSDIAQLEAKLADAREKQRLIIQRRAAAVNRLNAQNRIRQFDTSEAFMKFEAYENGIDRLEAQAGLVNSLRPKDASLRERFEELEHADTIERELEELRRKVRPS
jgi:phage shock protein A